MTEEEVEIFDSENPFWRDFFSDRNYKQSVYIELFRDRANRK